MARRFSRSKARALRADGTEPTVVDARLARFAHWVIRELSDHGSSDAEIAKRLNEMGLTTSRDKAWTRETVWVVRSGNGRGDAANQIASR
jgi:hypothetical protein